MRPLDIARAVLGALAGRGAGFAAHSPGARNLPLLAALRELPDLDTAECVDERAAGYLAVGWMRGRALAGAGLPPALVVCTSGGAVLNLLPAAAEAAESGLPLVLLCADRPAEEIGRGGNQTVDQLTPFSAVARHQLRLDPDNPDLDELERLLERWVQEPGVLQLDLPFREPLLAPADLAESRFHPLPAVLPWPEPACPVTEEMWRRELGPARRGLVWACDLPRVEDRRAARELAARLGWPLLADVGAGPGGSGELRHGEDLLPLLEKCEAVLQLGRRPVSRRLLETLHRRPGVVVDDHPGRQDPLGLDRPRWRCRPAALAEQLRHRGWTLPAPDLDWITALQRESARAGCLRARALGAHDAWSEAAVARRLAAWLPEGAALLAGNSLPVRLLDQWLGGGRETPCAANRGLSGIDGQLATALGLQRGMGRPAACLLGDLGLLHDLSSLALWARLGWPLLTVVLHNGGGGIFRLHPDSRACGWATSPHGLPLAEPARALGLEAARVGSVAELDACLESWVEDPRPLLVEARVPGDDHPRRVEALRRLSEPSSRDVRSKLPPARRVWLHGFLGSPADWDEVRARLAPAPGGEVAPWLPGHGPNPAPVTPSLDDWVDALLRELGGDDPLELVGYSLGGRLALRLALRVPERVRRLVLLGASPGLPGTVVRASRLELDRARAAHLRRDGLAAFLDSWYAMPLFATLRAHPRFAEWRIRRMDGDAAGLADALLAASPGAQADLWPDLANLAMPVLWLAGGLDTAYSTQAPRAAARCPDGSWALAEGAGHAAQLENPQAVAGRLAAFLAG